MDGDYARIAAAIRFLHDHQAAQPDLQQVAASVGLSPHHFQRLFRRWVGLSPKRYLEHLTVQQAKTLLQQGCSVLETGDALGLSGPGRLHEQFVAVEATSPGEYKRRWQGVEIGYGLAPSRFGEVLIAQTARGICLLSFVGEHSREAELERLKRMYGLARLRQDACAARRTLERVFAAPADSPARFHLNVRGTNFQINVWRALLRIERGGLRSYSEVAAELGRPAAVRAVANAVAANPVHFLIPCHRVLRADGDIGGYRGGIDTKRALLAWEADDPVSPAAARHDGNQPEPDA
jgi:AraC family transcriptional regulator of adaptative response/methylated-DNA-[protein]-cysteine methyltransferase